VNTGRLILTLVVLLGAAGCAALRPSSGTAGAAAPAVAGELPDGTGWWYARFSIDRPDGEPPRWYIGTLLGGEVIAPVFDRHARDILIWRVHRRAGDDRYGHVFSFIFYSTAAGAQRIYADLEGNPVLQTLRREGLVTGVEFDNLATISRPRIEDTSDRQWPLPVQQTWPALAMGGSRMWLDLVGEIAARHADEQDLEQRYRIVQQEVSDIWAKQGQRAVLHHLTALFAYQPVLITY
jgi:hypothetical protein